jgi:hypothetical protein
MITIPSLQHSLNVKYPTPMKIPMIARASPEFFDNIVIIDIRNATNVADPRTLKFQFCTKIIPGLAFTFHCKFSQIRGPSLTGFSREIDLSLTVYPKLSYHYVSILDGGDIRIFDQKAREKGKISDC